MSLVSVICLCYNHDRFVKEAIESVLNQTHKQIQIIVVDDMSTDRSRTIIREIADKHTSIATVFPERNLGNCAAFNLALKKAKGDFVIDFATDDVMMPGRIEKQVSFFKTLDASYGVVFTDATYIDEDGNFIRNHFDYLKSKGLLRHVPSGDVYKELISTYFVPSPTMLVRMEVMRDLNGYDEQLSYEDFDFWIRSSRKFKYAFQDERLTKIRKLRRSMSTGWYKPGDAQLHSTYLVCKKIRSMNTSEEEHYALARRLKYEIRQSVFSDNRKEAELFFQLLTDINHVGFFDRLMMTLSKLPVRLSGIRSFYHRMRY